MKLLIYVLLLSFITLSSCEKSRQKQEDVVPKSKDKLLTERSWKLFSYGWDINGNGLVDPSEEALANCEKDNTYSFSLNGSGVVNENTEICAGQGASNSFQWTFANNESEIDFIYGITVIIKLTQDSMVLNNKSEDPLKLILMYKH